MKDLSARHSEEDPVSMAREIAFDALTAARTKSAENPVLLAMGALCSYADYVLIVSGANGRHVYAIAEAIASSLKASRELDPIGREGERGTPWLLIDFGPLVVHVFEPEMRAFYDIEGLWVDATRVTIGAEAEAV